MLPKENELLSRFLYEPIWRFFESIHNGIAEAWEWFVATLEPYIWQIALLDLVIVLLLLVALLRRCFQ